MNFASDNTAGACPEMIDAIRDAAEGAVPSYGNDPLTGRLDSLFSDLFETRVKAYPVVSGTAANALALASLVDPWGRIVAHGNAHIFRDELNAPSVIAGGATVEIIPSIDGKLTPDLVRPVIEAAARDVHTAPVQALSFAQATEIGTVYSVDEVAALGAFGVPVHMDGARFANAVASLNCSPADLTWKAGVDVLCFGATKNGALDAEAVLFFDGEKNERFERNRKRFGHLLSKMRFVSAQLATMVEDGLWLKNAAHANAQARALADILKGAGGATLLIEPQANEVFALLEPGLEARLRQAGAQFFSFSIGEVQVSRFVASFATTDGELAAFRTAMG